MAEIEIQMLSYVHASLVKKNALGCDVGPTLLLRLRPLTYHKRGISFLSMGGGTCSGREHPHPYSGDQSANTVHFSTPGEPAS